VPTLRLLISLAILQTALGAKCNVRYWWLHNDDDVNNKKKKNKKKSFGPEILSLSIPKNDLGYSDMLLVKLWYGSILTIDGWGL
jgi:hypothetical protein